MNKNMTKIWISLLVVSTIGIILSFITAYGMNPIKGTTRDGYKWKEMLIWPFYFTIMSNTMALVVSSIMVFKKPAQNNVHVLRLKILATVCLTVTMLVYWGVLFPLSYDKQNAFQFIQNLFVHLFTPVMMITYFILEKKNTKRVEMPYLQTIGLLFIFPVLWITMGITMYFSLGGEKSDAIYPFLNFNDNSIKSTLIYVFGIAGSFIGFTALGVLINNKIKN